MGDLAAKEGSAEFNFELEDILTRWQEGFNIITGPIYSIGYITGYQDGSARLYFALHHLIVDAVSWRILIEDLRKLYAGERLGLKGSSYRQWVKMLKDNSVQYEGEREYWKGILADVEPISIDYSVINQISFSLDNKKTEQLLRECNKAYQTEINDILLTALSYSLAQAMQRKVNHVVIEGHGREEIDRKIDVSNTVGWFTTLYPIRLEVLETIEGTLINTKEHLRGVPNKGIGYGVLLGYRDLPKILFNYLGRFNRGDGWWQVAGEGSGRSVALENEDDNFISINGLILEEQLTFNISAWLGAKEIKAFAEVFKKTLEEIIDFTVSQKRSFLTASDIGKIIGQRNLDKLQEWREVEGVYLANSLQQGFIYHALSQGVTDDAYRVQMLWEYRSEINVKHLEEAWEYAQRRFSSLRLRFSWEEELVQIIDKEGELDWRFIDISEEEANKEIRLKEIREKDRRDHIIWRSGNYLEFI